MYMYDNFNHLALILEQVKEFTLKLEDTVAEKDSDVTFTCKVSEEDADVTWLIDSQSLPESDKYSVLSEDVTHTLTIRDLQPEDSCDVTAKFGDQSTSAKLSVPGECTHKLEESDSFNISSMNFIYIVLLLLIYLIFSD